MRVLLTGSRGLLAAAVIREFEGTADVVVRGHHELDITDRRGVERAVAEVKPQVVVNCAAYNHVDRAEVEAEAAFAVNALGVLALARAARAVGAALVHYSSDFVFDGTATSPYREDDEPNPRGVYASSKLLGEWLALEQPRAYVLRVESLFGHAGPGARVGSLAQIVRRIQEGEPVPVFVDRTVSPSYTPDVARATRLLLGGDHPPGVYHCVNEGTATWAGIATEIARLLDVPARLEPITLDAVKLPAPRPRYSALSVQKLAGAGIAMPTWQDALRRHLGLPAGGAAAHRVS